MARIHSYVVRYDSGFAPNPFYGYCTLATCKPAIRQSADVGDWIVGSASDDRSIRRGGFIVYAMKLTEVATFEAYWNDARFQSKKPFRRGSRKQSCGDNIYFRNNEHDQWQQLDSFHSLSNGEPNPDHVARDTGVNRVLISAEFIYFGITGPKIPDHLRDNDGRQLCKSGIGRSCFDDPALIAGLEEWLRGLGVQGYQGPPHEWASLRAKYNKLRGYERA